MKHVQSGSSCTIVSPLIHRKSQAERKQKQTKYDIFSVLSVPMCRTRPTKFRISVSQMSPKLRIMDKKGRFHDTPVQLVLNVYRFTSCRIGQFMLHSALCPYSTKAKNMVKSTVSVLFASLCKKRPRTKLFRDPTVSQVMHNPHITKFLWPTSRMCTAVPRALYCCL